MKKSERVRKAINKTQNEWDKMSLSGKRQKIINYWEGRWHSVSTRKQTRFIEGQMLLCKELSDSAICEYLDEVHKWIMQDAERIYQEAIEEEKLLV